MSVNKDIIIKEAKAHFSTDGVLDYNIPWSEFEQWLKSKLTALETATLEKAHNRIVAEGKKPLPKSDMVSAEHNRGYNMGYVNGLSFALTILHDLLPTNTNPVDEEQARVHSGWADTPCACGGDPKFTSHSQYDCHNDTLGISIASEVKDGKWKDTPEMKLMDEADMGDCMCICHCPVKGDPLAQIVHKKSCIHCTNKGERS